MMEGEKIDNYECETSKVTTFYSTQKSLTKCYIYQGEGWCCHNRIQVLDSSRSAQYSRRKFFATDNDPLSWRTGLFQPALPSLRATHPSTTHSQW